MTPVSSLRRFGLFASVFALAVLGMALVVGSAGAATIYGCVAKQTSPNGVRAKGSIRIVKKNKCLSYENLLTWNSPGPAGPIGPAGPAGSTRCP